MAIAYVNADGLKEAASSSTIAAPAQDHTGGNTIIVLVTSYTSGSPRTVSSIADTAGNTYARAGTVQSGDANHSQETWIAHNITGNVANIVTVTFDAAATNRGIIAAQYSGLATSNAYDTEATHVVTSAGTTHVTNTLATAQNEEILIGHYVNWSGTAGTFSSSGTSTFRYNTPGSGPTALFDRILSSTGTYSCEVATSGTSQGALTNKAFKAPGGGGVSHKNAMLLGIG